MPKLLNQPLTQEERRAILIKMGGMKPLTWAECDRLLDHIDHLEEV